MYIHLSNNILGNYLLNKFHFRLYWYAYKWHNLDKIDWWWDQQSFFSLLRPFSCFICSSHDDLFGSHLYAMLRICDMPYTYTVKRKMLLVLTSCCVNLSDNINLSFLSYKTISFLPLLIVLDCKERTSFSLRFIFLSVFFSLWLSFLLLVSKVNKYIWVLISFS